MDYGVTRIYSPDDGRAMGLQGMINDLVEKSDFPLGETLQKEMETLDTEHYGSVARVITAFENYSDVHEDLRSEINERAEKTRIPVLGITGTGGAGKSSMVDELVRRFLMDFPRSAHRPDQR